MLQAAGSEVEQVGSKPAPTWDADVAGGSYTCYAKALAPKRKNEEGFNKTLFAKFKDLLLLLLFVIKLNFIYLKGRETH